MATQMLYLHWKNVRMGLVPFVVAAFGLPLLVVQGAGRPEGITEGFYASFLLDAAQVWLPLFPMLAAATGLTLALSAWSWDHAGNHVYALALPVSRARYALLKFGGGALLALLPTAAMLTGGALASASVALPAGVQAYPLAVAVRFFYATLLVYALCFALAAGTIRTAVYVLTGLVATVIAGDLVLQAAAMAMSRPELASVNVTQWTYRLLTAWPGPFHILAGNWSLIDV